MTTMIHTDENKPAELQLATASPALVEQLKLLIQFRELLYIWALRELKVRYKQSLLGAAWAVLQPLSLMIVFSVIFTSFVKIPTNGVPYPIFSYSALMPWTFFLTSITMAVSSLTQNINLVTKIYFPREVLPLAIVGAAFIDFLVGALVLVSMMLFYRVPITWSLVLFPIIVIVQIALTVGIALLVSAVNVFYRDARFLVSLGLQLWMYATPIIYPLSVVPERFRGIYLLNPMAGLIESYRAVILHGEPPNFGYLAMAAVISAVVLVLGYRYFKHVEWQFADVI